MNKTKRNIFIIIISILTLSIACYLAYKLIPLFSSLKNTETQQKLEKYILDKGWKGWGGVEASSSFLWVHTDQPSSLLEHPLVSGSLGAYRFKSQNKVSTHSAADDSMV